MGAADEAEAEVGAEQEVRLPGSRGDGGRAGGKARYS